MGRLTNPRTGRSVALLPRTLVGRAGSCALRIDSRLVSSEHAVVWWGEGRWHVRDVGSRNGCLAGRATARHPRTRRTVTWVLGGVRPRGTYVDLGGCRTTGRHGAWLRGAVVPAEGGVLCLPGVDDPQWMIFQGADGGWVAEGPARTAPIVDGDAVGVAGEAYVVHRPAGDATTVAGGALLGDGGALRLKVSRDEEYVELELVLPTGLVALPQRAHTDLLLLLARARVDDAADAPADRGWRYADDGQRALGIDKATLNLYVFRARQQFSEAGLVGSAAAVERRIPTGQLRIGLERVQVTPLG